MQILSRDGLTPYYTFDSFAQRDDVPQPINIHNAILNLNSNVSQVSFKIEDGLKTVDRSKLKTGTQIKIQVGKDADFLALDESYCFVGFIDYPNISRPQTNQNDIVIVAKEVKQGLYNSQIDFVRNAPLSDLENPYSNKSRDFTLRSHLRKSLESRDFTPLQDSAIKDRFGIDTSGISDNLDVIIPDMIYQNTSLGNMWDDLASKIGFSWGFDYRGGLKKIFANYPTSLRAGVSIRSGAKDLIAFDPRYTSWYFSELATSASADTGAGFGTRIFGATRMDKHVVASSTVQTNVTSTTNKAIYQPFTTNEVRFNGLDLVLSMKGTVTSTKNRLNGGIFTNKVVGGINMPDISLMTWHVPLSDIKEDPTNVHINLDDIRTRFIDQNITFGFAIFQRSSDGDSDPNDDEDNTIRVYRGDNTDGGSSVAKGGDAKSWEKLTWKKDGPTYAHSVTSALSRIYAVTNYTLADQVGLIEPPTIDLKEIDDVNLAARYLTQILTLMSMFKGQPRISCSIPDDFLYRPLQTVKLYDYLAFPSGLDFELHEIEYDLSSNENSVTLGGIVYLDDAWSQNFPCTGVL
jgi:hypothetical protein